MDFPNHHVWNSIDLNVSDQVQKIFRYFLWVGSNIYVVFTEMNVNAPRRELEQGSKQALLGFWAVIPRGGSRNFKTRGRGPGAVEFLNPGFALMPIHTYPMFLLEE